MNTLDCAHQTSENAEAENARSFQSCHLVMFRNRLKDTSGLTTTATNLLPPISNNQSGVIPAHSTNVKPPLPAQNSITIITTRHFAPDITLSLISRCHTSRDNLWPMFTQDETQSTLIFYYYPEIAGQFNLRSRNY